MGWKTNLISAFVVGLAVFLTIFTNYPAPPYSPILFQWKDQGHQFKYKDYNIFYIGR